MTKVYLTFTQSQSRKRHAQSRIMAHLPFAPKLLPAVWIVLKLELPAAGGAVRNNTSGLIMGVPGEKWIIKRAVELHRLWKR